MVNFNRGQVNQDNEIYEADEEEELKNDAHMLKNDAHMMKKVLKDPSVCHLRHNNQNPSK